MNINMEKHSSGFIPDRRNFRIFQIGFNKCATRTLYKFFKKNGIPSVHYDGGRIAGSMFRHHRNKCLLVDINYKNIVFFSDMENIFKEQYPLYVAQSLFKKLDRQFPNSKFILNTRDKEDWLRSRIAHDNGDYIRIISEKMSLSKSEVIEYWRNMWDRHHREVLHHFRNRPNDLLVFNIDIHEPKRLCRFFQNELQLKASFFGHQGKTPEEKLIQVSGASENLSDT
jgi:hypothetical protein